MPDDDRSRRRLGDATRERIAGLAEGWSVEAPKPAPAAPEPEPRKKPRTVPPPPPGSPERAAIERQKPPTKPPPIPKKAPDKSPDTTFVKEQRTPPVIVDESLGAKSVPLGEFDSSQAETIKRDAAEALLQIIPEVDVRPQRDDPTTIDESSRHDEPRGDATEIQKDFNDGKTASGGKLRRHAALRRKRGLAGDVRYVFTAMLGVRRSRRELGQLEQKQNVRQQSRRRHLVTLGRTAITADAFEHAALAQARDQLAATEDERSRHAGSIAGADAELFRVRRDREEKLAEYTAGIAKCEAELVELAKKLEPLERDAAVSRKRADELRASLTRIEKKIAETEASMHSVKGKQEPAAIQAELATLRADRLAVQRDEPKIAAELDALNPRIAGIEAARTEATKRRKQLDDAEAEDKRRTAELLEAIASKRKVVERAAGEAEAARDRVLFELGERLYVDRPAILGAQLSPIDTIDLELGETDRRIMELREILSNIDKAKVARGAAVIVAAILLAGGFVAWILYLAL